MDRKYLLFASYRDKPAGGMNDFSGFYPSVGSAKQGMNPRRQWAQIALLSNFCGPNLYLLWEYRDGVWTEKANDFIALLARSTISEEE